MKEHILKITDNELRILEGALDLFSHCNGVYCINAYEKAMAGDEEEIKEYKFHGYSMDEIKGIIAPLLSVRDKVNTEWDKVIHGIDTETRN